MELLTRKFQMAEISNGTVEKFKAREIDLETFMNEYKNERFKYRMTENLINLIK
jgi:hypothetical protein